MFLRDALLHSPKPVSAQRAAGYSGVHSVSNGQAHRKKRSDFARAYSRVSFAQALRVVLLVAIGLAFIKVTHVAQAQPGVRVSGLAIKGWMDDLRFSR